MTAVAIEIEHKTTDQVFSYYHGEDFLHFNVTLLARIREAVPQMFRRITMDIGKPEYDLCMNNRGIEEPKVAALSADQCAEPGYGVIFEDGAFSIVDGHHRVVRRYRDDLREMDFYVAPPGIWGHCLIQYTEEGNRKLAAGMPPKVENPESLPTRARLHERITS